VSMALEWAETGLRMLQDPAQPDSRVVDGLFGVKLHTSLKCEESSESIEVGVPRCTSQHDHTAAAKCSASVSL
jgi:hypothetical protein